MLRQVYQPAGAVFIAAHNVLSQRQVQERLREYIIIKMEDFIMAKRGGFPGGMPGNMNNLMKQAQKKEKCFLLKVWHHSLMCLQCQ